jgi:predicted alpha/beta-hydrolase family hydrolase
VRELRVPVGDRFVTATVQGAGDTAVVLGHGAGGDRRTPFLVKTAEALAASGRQAVLYNFIYSDQGRRAPDPPEVLEAATRAVGDHVARELGAARIVHGGKSMGGRIASQVVAKGAPADALVFLGYPLHPPGRPDTLRDRHLPAIRVPMLFIQGTRDSFARMDLLERVIETLGARATLHVIEGGDHSFGVPRGGGRTRADAERQVIDAVLEWLKEKGL